MLVLNITKPVAGLVIASLCKVVILGGKKPLLVLFTSSNALESAALPLVLMAKDCPLTVAIKAEKDRINIAFLMNNEIFMTNGR